MTVLTQDDMIDPHLEITIEIGTITMTIRTDIGLAGPDPIHTVIATGVPVKVPHEEVILGPITDPHAAAYHATETQCILLSMRHSTQQILIMQKFFQGSQ